MARDVCDSPTCPAGAEQYYDIYGQDFKFCNHHAREIIPTIPPEHVTLHDREVVTG